MPKQTVLVTGASGEIGHALVSRLSSAGASVIALDVAPIPRELAELATATIAGSVTDAALLHDLVGRHAIDTVFHLAALLSTRCERDPLLGHQVNVDGTMAVLGAAASHSAHVGAPVKIVFPSSIAVYGLSSRTAKAAAGRVAEDEWMQPRTMYGCNKLYCELLGMYYSTRIETAARAPSATVDFRALRFPGLISAATIPSGGTSDYAPEMIHAAAKGAPYRCFVVPETRIPFMAMPDAIEALLGLAAAPRERLTRCAYNVSAFNPSAREIHDRLTRAFPGLSISYAPDAERQRIVDSWPSDVDDARARTDWGYAPTYDLARAFDEYLLPAVRKRYQSSVGTA